MTSPSSENAPSQTSGEHCLIGQNNVVEWYQDLIGKGILQPDPAQGSAVSLLQQLANDVCLEAENRDERTFIARLLGRRNEKKRSRGLYIHGTVGRGKSFLMDGFFLNLPVTNKLRVHFHGFMRHFHADMKDQEGKPDPLAETASRLAASYALICFDEFHVSDIADAMILARMLEILLDHNVILVATSNYKPDDLYPNGLARERFLPAIDLLNNKLAVHNLDGEEDYRLRTLEQAGVYLHPDHATNRKKFADLFEHLATGITLMPSVKVKSRRISAVKRSGGAIWFEFAELCGGNWSQVDYLQLAERFTTIMLSGVPELDKHKDPEALRRFTWLVDVLYDAKVNLALLTAAPLNELFQGEGGESGRTLSRLEEMQSVDYFGQTGVPPSSQLANRT